MIVIVPSETVPPPAGRLRRARLGSHGCLRRATQGRSAVRRARRHTPGRLCTPRKVTDTAARRQAWVRGEPPIGWDRGWESIPTRLGLSNQAPSCQGLPTGILPQRKWIRGRPGWDLGLRTALHPGETSEELLARSTTQFLPYLEVQISLI